MPRKKLRNISDWKKEISRKRCNRLRPASPYAFRARRNKRESDRSLIDEECQLLNS